LKSSLCEDCFENKHRCWLVGMLSEKIQVFFSLHLYVAWLVDGCAIIVVSILLPVNLLKNRNPYPFSHLVSCVLIFIYWSSHYLWINESKIHYAYLQNHSFKLKWRLPNGKDTRNT
jgi:hypothetical protein